MTDPDWTPEDERIGRALQARADGAPRAEDLGWDLAATARRRVRRRRHATMTAAATLVAVVGFGGFWSLAGPDVFPAATSGNDSAGNGEAASAPETNLPPTVAKPQDRGGTTEATTGWRWESYGGVEVSVPANWSYGISDAPWCLNDRGQINGEVGRPGVVRSIKCPDIVPIYHLGEHVWLSGTEEGRPKGRPATEDLGEGWIRDTILVGGVRIEVQTHANPGVRDRILKSVREVSTEDSNGCPVRHPITREQQRYDVPAGQGLPWDAVVTGLSACRYQIRSGDPNPPLVGSLRFPEARAKEVLAAIRELPGANPAVRLPKCMPDLAPPAEAIVLLFDTADGRREIRVGYDGCASAGFFNGTGSRGLYAEALKLFAIGPVRPTSGTHLTSLSGW